MISVSKRGDLSTAQLDKEWLTQPGVFTIRVEGIVNSEKIGKTEVEFVIFDQDKEKANPAADPQLLARMSDQTKSFGGRAVVPWRAGHKRVTVDRHAIPKLVERVEFQVESVSPALIKLRMAVGAV